MSTNIPAKVEERHRDAAKRWLHHAHGEPEDCPLSDEECLAEIIANAERETLERAAQIAESAQSELSHHLVAAAIRALKEQP